MRPLLTEPLADHSFSTTPTRSFGMNRTVSHTTNERAARAAATPSKQTATTTRKTHKA